MDLDYTAQQRLIKLTRGEIIVTCARSTKRLHLRDRCVCKVVTVYEGAGARFILHQDDDCTRLSVTRGIVAIHSPRVAEGEPIRVQAGQSYLIDHQQAKVAAPLDMDAGAWVDGLIVTRNMRLRECLNEVARYRDGYLTCSSDIADLRLSGVFRLESTDKQLAILPKPCPCSCAIALAGG